MWRSVQFNLFVIYVCILNILDHVSTSQKQIDLHVQSKLFKVFVKKLINNRILDNRETNANSEKKIIKGRKGESIFYKTFVIGKEHFTKLSTFIKKKHIHQTNLGNDDQICVWINITACLIKKKCMESSSAITVFKFKLFMHLEWIRSMQTNNTYGA